MTTTYISLLRGINVSGKNLIKMAALKELFETLNFHNVITYIQSGNIVFQSNLSDSNQINQLVTAAITRYFGLIVPVFTLTQQQLTEIIASNPFKDSSQYNPAFIHCTFLPNNPQSEELKMMHPELYLPDKFQVVQNVIYLYCPNGYGQTKLTNTFFERKLQQTTTTRNWKTTQQLLVLANAQ